VTTNGAILATDVDSSGTDADANDIILTSGGAGNDITITTIDSGSASGDTFLTSGGGIFESAVNTVNNITADGLRLVTANGEGVASEVPGGQEGNAGHANLLDTTANSLEASISGSGLFLVNSRALNLEDLDLTGEGTGTTAITSTNGTVRVNTTVGDLTVTGLVNGTGQLVTLNSAAGSINDNPADDMAPVNDIVASQLALRAAFAVGSMGNQLEVDTTTMAYTVGNGGIFVSDIANGLTINTVDTITSSSSAGSTEITSSTALTVAHNVDSTGAIIMTAFDTTGTTDDLTVNTMIQITSSSKIILQAGDDLTLQDRSLVDSGGGQNVVLNVETTTGSRPPGNVDAPGSTVTLLGSIGAAPAATVSEVNGGTNDDTVIVYPQNRVLTPTDTTDAINHELLLNLAAADDTYRIHMNGLSSGSGQNRDVRIEDTSGNDNATIYGTSGSDNTIDVRNLDMATGTAGGEILNNTTGERITYTGSTSVPTGVLEQLEVNGGEFQGLVGQLDPADNPDIFNVQPSNTTQILIHGNTPQFGSHADDFPQTSEGDILNLETFGNRFSIIGKSIFTANGTFNGGGTYAGISFRNIESIPLDDPPSAPIGTETLRFDFNAELDTGNSPTQTGYTEVLNSQYYGADDGAGGTNTFGWVVANPADPEQVVPVSQVDLGAAAITLADFADLNRDYHMRTSAETFRTDITDGWYLVSVKSNASNDLRVTDATNTDVLSANQTF
ncbi:MAG: hypothetical protein VB858_12645, partial [Planctomycetaceae bacterium]